MVSNYAAVCYCTILWTCTKSENIFIVIKRKARF